MLPFTLMPLLLSCGSDGPGGPSEDRVARIEVSPDRVTLTAFGASEQFTATALDAAGKPVPGVKISWKSMDPKVAIVDSTGLATAVGPGGIEVVASIAGHAGRSVISVAQAPNHLAFTALPANAVAGSPFSTRVKVEIRDANGHAVVGSGDEVVLSLLGGPEGVELHGTLARRAGNGMASFDGLRIEQAGSDYRLQASAAQLPPVESDTFTVLPAEAGRLVFSTQPPRRVTPNTPFTVQVDVEDHFGNRIPDWKGRVSLSLEDNTGAASLAGTLQLSTENGSVRFTDLSLDNAGEGYTLRARAPGPPSASSERIDVRLLLTSVNSRREHTCGVASTGTAYCWGNGDDGRLGNGDTDQKLVPTAVASDLKFNMISAGFEHTCGVSEAGDAYCWGAGARGRLGNGDTTSSALLVNVRGNLKFAMVSAGAWHTCGLTTAGKAYCWGDNSYGAIGDNATENRLVPTPVTGGHAFASISAGFYFTCGVTTANKVYCWGNGALGRLGHGATTNKLVPTQVAGFVDFTSVSAGSSHACGISTYGSAYCWGFGLNGELGNGSSMQSLVPSPVSGGHQFSSMSIGAAHTCGLYPDRSAYCWGFGGSGRLGNNSTTTTTVPVPVSGNFTFSSIAAGDSHTCAQATSGEAFCWGYGSGGLLGNSATANSLVPVRVSFTEP